MKTIIEGMQMPSAASAMRNDLLLDNPPEKAILPESQYCEKGQVSSVNSIDISPIWGVTTTPLLPDLEDSADQSLEGTSSIEADDLHTILKARLLPI